MSFWLVAALLTVVAALAVMFPYLRPPAGLARAGAHDLEVYRDQIDELERDVARGTIAAGEAVEARAEIGRRILRLEDAAERPGRGGARAARLLAAAAVLAVPLVSWVFYSGIGSPQLPSEPLQARLTKDPKDSTIEELVARAEKHLADDPQDGRGWDLLAPIYFRLERYADAANAYKQALRYSGPSAEREAGLGEAITAQGGGVVSADAEEAFQQALELDPKASKPRFFLAMAKAQEGKNDEAREIWAALRADLPQDSPWRGAVEQALTQLASSKDGATAPRRQEAPDEMTASRDAVGPSAEQMKAAAKMAPEQRTAMIEGMVTRLDERLRQRPDDVEGWTKLVRSYLVLGRKQDAVEAAKRGLAALVPSADAAKLRSFALSQGLEGIE